MYYVSLCKTYLDKLDKFIFQKRALKTSFSANNGAAVLNLQKMLPSDWLRKYF